MNPPNDQREHFHIRKSKHQSNPASYNGRTPPYHKIWEFGSNMHQETPYTGLIILMDRLLSFTYIFHTRNSRLPKILPQTFYSCFSEYSSHRLQLTVKRIYRRILAVGTNADPNAHTTPKPTIQKAKEKKKKKKPKPPF